MNKSDCAQSFESHEDLDIGDMFDILNYLFKNKDPNTVLPTLDKVLDKILLSLDNQLHKTTLNIWQSYFQSLDKNLHTINKITKTKYILAKIVQEYKDFWQQDDLQPAIKLACDEFEISPQCAIDKHTVYIENPQLAKNLQEYFSKYQTSQKVCFGVPDRIKTNSLNEAHAVLKLVETLDNSKTLPKISNDLYYRYARMRTIKTLPYRQDQLMKK